jgi:hypothetical protein
MHYQQEEAVKKIILFLITGLFALSISGVASADITTFTDRLDFNNQGVIVYNSNFQDFGTDPIYLGDDYTRGDVTYDDGIYFTIGSSFLTSISPPIPYVTTEPLIINVDMTTIIGEIETAPMYKMLGFDVGGFNVDGTNNLIPMTITVFTNKNTYTYPNLTMADAQAGLLDFKGYTALPGEYFTEFQIMTQEGAGTIPGITNVALGSPTPEPATCALMGIGVLLIAFRLKQSGSGSAFMAAASHKAR